MTAQSDQGRVEQGRAGRASLARVWLAIAAVVVLVRLPGSFMAGGARMVEATPAVWRGLSDTSADRIARHSAITTAFIEAVRTAIPSDGRLVLYSPYGGAELEFLLRSQFERTKNLLYPDPRDVHFARNKEELLSWVEPGLEAKLLVLDGTQEPVDLTIGGDYDLVHEEPIGTVARLRLWRLRRAR